MPWPFFNPVRIRGHSLRRVLHGGCFSARGLTAALFFVAAISQAAQYGNFTYTDHGTSITITGYSTTAAGAATIPSTINGKPVVAIDNSAFVDRANLTGVTIPASVKAIGNSAFAGCGKLTGVTIPSGVTVIERSTFAGCGGLKTVTIPASVTAIQGSAFSGCGGLTSVTLPANLTFLGELAFARCIGLTTVTIPAKVYEIGASAFDNCDGLTSVTIQLGVTIIGAQAFNYCDYLASVTIPSSVVSIGRQAFVGNGFTSVAIPASVTSIGDNAFSFSSTLTSINVAAANPSYTSVNGVLFDKAKTLLIHYPSRLNGPYEILPTVTRIGNDAFHGNIGLTGVTIPPSVTRIGDRAFNYCWGLTKMVIPNGVTSIGILAFGSCTGLAEVMIPSSVTGIGVLAFSGCGKVKSISVAAGNASYSSRDGVLFNKDQTTLVEYPAGGSGDYTIPPGVTRIGDYAFSQRYQLTGLSIPSGVTQIGPGAFESCGALTKVTLPASITRIDSSAFYFCSKLINATFVGPAPVMGSGVFQSAAGGFKVYYFNGAEGFTSPTWLGYASASLGDLSPAGSWLLAKGFAHSTNLRSDPNGDGVNLLMAYALNLDPYQNLGPHMPKPVFAADQMRLSFYAGSEGVTYAVEASADLKKWSGEGVTISAPEAGQIRTATVDRSGPSRFMRLVVSH